jgi:uncharacterized membrane protein
MRRICLVMGLVGCGLFLGAPGAAAKSYTLPAANVHVTVGRDGSVGVVEQLTYSFSGEFSGAYRDIPLRPGESLSGIRVSEGGVQYLPGAPTELGSSGAPNTFGVAAIPQGQRIVWHYRASSEQRTFRIEYTVRGLVMAHSDVADLNLRVWGDEWTVPLDHLEAEITLPRAAPGEVRVWGHARLLDVEGETALKPDGTGATLTASSVAPGNWVEMRVVFPRTVLGAGAPGAQSSPGAGLETILAEERGYAELAEADARRRADDERRVRSLLDRLPWLLMLGLVAATAPAGVVGTGIWWRYGREPRVAAAPRHVFEPPGDDPPAMVAALLDPGHAKVPGDAFAATLFDLIRRGYLDAMPTMTEKQTWGGLRREDVSDIAISRTSKPGADLRPFEAEALDAVMHAMGTDENHFHLTEFHETIKSQPTHYSQVFTDFKNKVMNEVDQRGWWIRQGQTAAILGAVTVALLAAGSIFIATRVWNTSRGLPWASIWWGAAGAVLAGNAVALIGFIAFRRGWERRSQRGAEAEAEAVPGDAIRPDHAARWTGEGPAATAAA